MIRILSLTLLLCISGLQDGKVIQVDPGGDLSMSCISSGSGQPTWDKLPGNSLELSIGGKAYLLVQDFRPQDEGAYSCESDGTREKLEPKHESLTGVKQLYRAVGQRAHLFCARLADSDCDGKWSWTPTSKSTKLSLDKAKRRGNDFSHHLLSVEWANSGMFYCDVTCQERTSKVIKLVVFNVSVEPIYIFDGEEAKLCCSLSHWESPVRLCWIKLITFSSNYNRSQRYHSDDVINCSNAERHCISMKVSLETQRWACVIFTRDDELRGFLPVHLNVSTRATISEVDKHTSTLKEELHSVTTKDDITTLTTQRSESATGLGFQKAWLTVVFCVLSLILIPFSCIVLWRGIRRGVIVSEKVEMHGEDRGVDDGQEAEDGISHVDTSVTYSSVHFKRKPGDLTKAVASEELINMVNENADVDGMVIYAGLKGT